MPLCLCLCPGGLIKLPDQAGICLRRRGMAGMAPPPDSTRWLMMLAESGGPTPSALQQQQPPAGAYWTTGVPLLELRQAIIDHGYSGRYWLGGSIWLYLSKVGKQGLKLTSVLC